MKKIFRLLDTIIFKIKEKIDSSSVSYNDTKILMTLEIVRLELSIDNKMTDSSLGAIKEIVSMTSFESYRHDYLVIYNDIQELFKSLEPYNENLYSDDVEIIGFKHDKWCNYFEKAIFNLLDNLRPPASPSVDQK